MEDTRSIKTERYTFADYMAWDDGIRYELIDGLPTAMSPAPTWFHQDICLKIASQIEVFLKGKRCKVLTAPFDVRLNADEGDNTVVQPDIIVICDRTKLDKKGHGCKGAPDMVAEVLSPFTAKMDKLIKYRKYLQYGVREYWIIDPDSRTVEVNLLEQGRFYKTVYGEAEIAPIQVLEGCQIDLADVFSE